MHIENQIIPADLYYDKNDWWVKVDGRSATIGMTEYGQKNTGDILYLELVGSGALIRRGEKLGSIESGKWVGNLTSPLTGVIEESNREVEDNPRKVNADAYGEGWMYQLMISDPDEVRLLMTAREYAEWIAELAQCESEMG
jgi:glycine cleavage system H protein